MANTTEHAHQRMTNSIQQVGIAFGSTLNPALEKIYDAVAKVLNGLAGFIEKHPMVVKAVTAIAIGLGVAAVALTAFTAATELATAAIIPFLGLIASNPIGLAVAGIAAATIAIGAFAAMTDKAETETLDLTETSRAQYMELNKLHAEYDRACDAYGKNSEEALRLKNQIDDLQASFDSTRQTLEEFAAECDAVTEAHQEMMKGYEDTMKSIDEQETGTLALIQRLEDMAAVSTKTAASENEMKAIIEQLNKEIPDLALSYDDLSKGATGWSEAVKRAAKAQAEQQRQAQAFQTYVDALTEQKVLEEQIAEVEENLALARERLANMSIGPGTTQADRDAYYEASDAVAVYEEKLAELNGALEENGAVIADIEGRWEEQARAAEESLNAAQTGEEAATAALQAYEGQIRNLCDAYDAAYKAAKESFDGQFGLFDEAQANMDSTVANAQKALDSQLAYWQSYSENINVLKSMSAEDLGMTQQNYDALMSYVQDGSAEAAGLAQDLVSNIEAGNTEAVAALGETIGEVQAARDEAASAVAEMQTDLMGQLDELTSQMKETIDGLDLSEEAKTQAKATIDGYVTAIEEGSGRAIDALNAMKNDISAALSTDGESNVEVTVEFTPDTEAVDGYTPDPVEADVDFTPDTSAVDGVTIPDQSATVNYTPGTEALDGYVPPDKQATGTYLVDSAKVDAYQPDDKDADAIYNVDSSRVDSWTPPNKTATLTYNIQTNGSIPGHAKGTDYAEDVFIAGEKGPELVVGHEGAQVFTAQETERILRGLEPHDSEPKITAISAVFPAFWSWVEKLTDKLWETRPEPAIGVLDGIEAFASGTKDSPDAFIAGDRGPELVVGQPHSEIFPTDETERIIDAVEERPLHTDGEVSNAESNTKTNGTSGGAAEDSKRIYLEIAGSGAIDVSARTDKNAVLEIIQDHIKPVLVGIIQQEIYEEGEQSYEY